MLLLFELSPHLWVLWVYPLRNIEKIFIERHTYATPT